MQKIQIATIVALLACGSFISAAPAPSENNPDLVKRAAAVFTPDIQVQIKEYEPDVASGDRIDGQLFISNGENSIHTLCSFDLPESIEGMTCEFRFVNPAYMAGSMTAYLYSVSGEVSPDNTWNHRPDKDQHLATFTAQYEENALFRWGWEPFPCWGGRRGFELIPQYDENLIQWARPNGLQIVAYS